MVFFADIFVLNVIFVPEHNLNDAFCHSASFDTTTAIVKTTLSKLQAKFIFLNFHFQQNYPYVFSASYRRHKNGIWSILA